MPAILDYLSYDLPYAERYRLIAQAGLRQCGKTT